MCRNWAKFLLLPTFLLCHPHNILLSPCPSWSSSKQFILKYNISFSHSNLVNHIKMNSHIMNTHTSTCYYWDKYLLFKDHHPLEMIQGELLPPASWLFPCLAYSLALKMKMICYSEMSVDFYQTTWHYNSENHTFQFRVNVFFVFQKKIHSSRLILVCNITIYCTKLNVFECYGANCYSYVWAA